MKFKRIHKKPINADKVTTILAIITTIVLIIVVSFFNMRDNFNKEKEKYQETLNAINSLNAQYSVSALVKNKITEEDYLSLQTKCAYSNWDLFENNAFNEAKYNLLNNSVATLELTDREYGKLLQGILNITTANTYNIVFDEISINAQQGINKVDLRFVFSFSLKTVLSITSELEEMLNKINITLPNYVYAVNSCTLNLLNNSFENNIITYNSLNEQDSKQITALLNAGKEGENNNFETFASRLMLAFNKEITQKTEATVTFFQGGLSFVK